MHICSMQDAKAKFSEFLDACLEEGPQRVTRRGAGTAVLLSVEAWRRLQSAASCCSPMLRAWRCWCASAAKQNAALRSPCRDDAPYEDAMITAAVVVHGLTVATTQRGSFRCAWGGRVQPVCTRVRSVTAAFPDALLEVGQGAVSGCFSVSKPGKERRKTSVALVSYCRGEWGSRGAAAGSGSVALSQRLYLVH